MSFRICSISVNVNSSEDHEIHCLKDGGEASDATPPAIFKATHQLVCEPDTPGPIFHG